MRISIVVLALMLSGQAYSQEKKKRVGSHLSITPGVDFSNMRSQDSNGTRVNFPQSTNWRLGAEFEFPIAKGKWAILIEPTFQQYKADGPYPLKYRSLETPMGFRRFFAVGKSAAIFVDGMFVLDIPFRYTIELAPGLTFVSTTFKTNFAAGAGIALHRFTAEYRFYSQRTAKDDTDSFIFNYNKRAIIIGYRLY